jgi:hypothetical protein
MLKNAVKLVAIPLLLSLSLPALALEDTLQNREQQAERYIQAITPDVARMADSMAKQLPPKNQDEFREAITKHLDVKAITDAQRAAAVRTFSADELQALADFYSSALGKSAMAKMNEYQAEVMPVMSSKVQDAMEKAQEEKDPTAAKGEQHQ